MQKDTIGFIGAGVMGSSMIRNLLGAGYGVRVFTRTRSKAEALLEEGAEWVASPAEAARGGGFVISIVGFPEDVEQVYFGDEGVFEGAIAGTVAIDMTTSRPMLAERIYAFAKQRSIHAMDAPVSGGDLGARSGSLSIMAGGDAWAFAKAKPVFEAMGKNIVHQGPAGSGQFTKMANQIAIASGMVGVCESLHYAKQAGLDPVNVLKSIDPGAAGSWSLSNLMPRALAGDFEPGFYVKHFIKDMKIAVDSARELGVELPGLKLAVGLYERIASNGKGDLGTQSLFELYEKGEANTPTSR